MWKSQILERDGWKSRVKTGKTVIFPRIAEKLFQFFPGTIEAPFLHVLDPNSPSFNVKCPRKCQKPYNFDIFYFSQIYTSPLLNFEINPKFDHILLYVYY